MLRKAASANYTVSSRVPFARINEKHVRTQCNVIRSYHRQSISSGTVAPVKNRETTHATDPRYAVDTPVLWEPSERKNTHTTLRRIA